MKILSGISVVLLTALFCAGAVAEPRFAEPILLTSSGQSADVLMLKSLLTKDSLDFKYLPNASASDVAGMGSVIVVLGGSSKGLGAAKISADDETARVTGLLDAAQQAAVPVLAIHMGGLNRRGSLSDPFNRLGAEKANRLLIYKEGNGDGFFTTIAGEKSIPLDLVASPFEIGASLKVLYRATE